MKGFELNYWRQYQEGDAFEIPREDLVEFMKGAIDEWNDYAEEESQVRPNEMKSILRFGKNYWEKNNNIIDYHVIQAYIAQMGV